MTAEGIVVERLRLLGEKASELPVEKKEETEEMIKSLRTNITFGKLSQETLFELSLALDDMRTNLFSEKFGIMKAEIWEIVTR